MLFQNKEVFKEACRNWGIRHRYQIYFTKNDNLRVRCKCFKECGFFIYAAKYDMKDKDDKTFQVRSFNLKHKINCCKQHKNFHLTSKWLAQKYLEEFRNDSAWPIQSIIDRVKKDMKLKITRMKAWRAKTHALKQIIGDEKVTILKTV